MKSIITILGFVIAVSSSYCAPPPRDGVAAGYMTTPNSFVYRSPFSEKTALDFWLDMPEVSFGDYDGFRIGVGAGYAIFISRQDNFALMLRPQFSVAYIEDIYNGAEIGMGITAAVVAYLDEIGIHNIDIYAGVSLGSVIELGEDYTRFNILLTRKGPFGLLIGFMYYF